MTQKIDELSNRVRNLLKRNGILTDEMVQTAPDHRLWAIRGMGNKSFFEIRQKLPFKSK